MGIATVAVKVRRAFPSLSQHFADLLIEAMKRHGFTDERAIDAVNHVIDTCEYPEPAIARFVSFDKRRRLYSHAQVCQEIDKGEVWDNFNKVEHYGRTYWAKNTEQ